MTIIMQITALIISTCISTYISYSGRITIIQFEAQELAVESNGNRVFCAETVSLVTHCHDAVTCHVAAVDTLWSGCHELSHRSMRVRQNVTEICVTCIV